MGDRIGILIYSGANLFINGLVQNAYFMLRCFEKCGFRVDFLCQNKDPKPFEQGGLELKYIGDSAFDFKQYRCIITGCAFLSGQEYTKCKSLGIQTVDFICGNHYNTDILLFINGANAGSTFHGSEKTADCGWTIPSYAYTIDYMETVRKYPIHIVPHLWSPELILTKAKIFHNVPKERLFYTTKHRSKINIIILEPNLNFQKAALTPLVASELLWKRWPNRVESVIISNIHKPLQKQLISTLAAPIKIIDRQSIEKILIDYNPMDAMPIFVCNQNHNTLNYLYYELLYLGYPLVHNSPDLDSCGYKYDTLEDCVKQILYADEHHIKELRSYQENAKTFLEKINPENPEVCSLFEQMLT
jgi:hypothetical protein